MDNYTSDSSDSDSVNKVLDFSYMQLNATTIYHNLEMFEQGENQFCKEIETILLSHNDLKILPQNLNRFVNLKALDISSNILDVLPDIFHYCPSLSVLLAKNNNFNNESLPKCFTNCSNLRELNLSGNQLSVFPEQVLDCTNLKFLYLGGNQITNISRNIWKLTSLQVLSLGGNLLTEVPSTVGQLKILHALVLCDNQIEKIPAEIANLQYLKSLLLHKNRLKTLPQEILTLKNLTELSLRENPLVVRFVTTMTHHPATLLELAARNVKICNIFVQPGAIPETLFSYLDCAHRCVNPNCKGVFFDNRVEHVKFVDFCGKYRIPLLQYLCSSKCITEDDDGVQPGRSYMMQKVLLG
ncbi:BspA type Leucine rich repeat region (6 copies) [Popillia japonica]|uniref:BspA type Leucine rich repeat region (6 copies) n=1 Tax=Popillia japonica TaxID=7064 RepID=A0AAW1K2S9_POPJA